MQHIIAAETEVLIVDDNTQYSTILTRMLKSLFGFKAVTYFDSPAAALAYMEKRGPLEVGKEGALSLKLLFIDYHFPGGVTGDGLIRSLSERGLLAGRVCFLITAEPSVDNMKQAQAAGALGIIAKPFDRAELTRQIAKADRLLEVGDGEEFESR